MWEAGDGSQEGRKGPHLGSKWVDHKALGVTR